MKILRSLIFAICLVLIVNHSAEARLARLWTEEELFAKADLVVVATPTGSRDTTESIDDFFAFLHPPAFDAKTTLSAPISMTIDLPRKMQLGRQRAVGVETTFAVTRVLKGSQATASLTLHHYRGIEPLVFNAPRFVDFEPGQKRAVRLFLIREADGRYAPVAGQLDAQLSVLETDAQ